MSKLKCGCVIATSKNTASVRKGFEMGGYVKKWCHKHDPQASRSGVSGLRGSMKGEISYEEGWDAPLEPCEISHQLLILAGH